VPLAPIFPEQQSDAGLAAAQKKLQESSEAFVGALRTSEKFQKALAVDDESLAQAISTSKESPRPSDEFGDCVERILNWQEGNNKGLSGKLKGFLVKLWPVADFVLGIVSFGADVRAYHASSLGLYLLLEGRRIFPFENYCEWSKSRSCSTSMPLFSSYEYALI
jgi:hypothetical protein